jgi:hypothetical protein
MPKKFFLQWGEGPAVVIKALRRNGNVFDVFVGNTGWDTWSRVERKEGELTHISGAGLDQRTYNFVKGRVIK